MLKNKERIWKTCVFLCIHFFNRKKMVELIRVYTYRKVSKTCSTKRLWLLLSRLMLLTKKENAPFFSIFCFTNNDEKRLQND